MEMDFSPQGMNQGYVDSQFNQGYTDNQIRQGYSQMQGYPQTQGYSQQQFYPQMQNQYGCTQSSWGMQPIRYSKMQIIDALRSYIQQSSGVAISAEDKIEEIPDNLRHACAPCGVSFLQKCVFPVPEMGLVVPFYFCTACGKLFYAKDFM